MRRRNRRQVSTDDSASNGSDDSYTANNNKPAAKVRGRPANRKKARVLSGSDDDVRNQPSTSQNGNADVQIESESENDSGSESVDSDYEHIIDRSAKKKPSQQKKGNSSKGAAKGKKTQNDVNPSRSSQRISSSNQKNSRASTSNSASVDPSVVEQLAQKCVYFLFVEEQKKYAIKKKAIITHVFQDEDKKLYVPVIKKANLILKKTYGMELIELENSKDSYLIVNILSRELGMHDFVELSRLKQQQHGLILFIVAVIYMNDNVITEDELTACLKVLGIDLMSKRMHPIFGDVKKYITQELVKQLYLNYECVSKDPPRYEFTWGLRAKQEFGKMDLLKFVCQIMDDTSPEDWKAQFKDAEESSKSNSD